MRYVQALLLSALVGSYGLGCGNDAGGTSEESAKELVDQAIELLGRGDDKYCDLLTRAGENQVLQAHLGSIIGSETPDALLGQEELRQQLEDLEASRGASCPEALSDVVYDVRPNDWHDELVEDVDISADGDLARVTRGGVWELNELNGKWFISSSPMFEELVRTAREGAEAP